MKTLGHNRQGLSLVELVVVLAVTGLLSVVAAVYISSGETALRTSLQNFRFNLEVAKSEAVKRKAEVYLDFYTDGAYFDCNGDDQVDENDRCYVIYQDVNGNRYYDPGANMGEKIQVAPLERTIRMYPPLQPLTFYPLGGTVGATLSLESAAPSNCDDSTLELECLLTTYEIRIQSVGRIRVGEKIQRCEGISHCDSYG